MTNYPRSAYKNPFNSLSSYGSASARGWGKGWPNCQTGKMKTITAQDSSSTNIDIRVTVRAELAEMVLNLLEATDKIYNVRRGVTGAYNCRPIAGTSRPSNHSWGMAIDINWDKNPMSSTFKSEIPPKVVAMWNDCGWYWGGFYGGRPDTMHFEYVGKPSDVASDTSQAKKYNKGASTPTTPSTPSTSTVVAFATILKAAKTDPASVTGNPPAGTKDMVDVVEEALVKAGFLDKQYADGLFGSKTVEAYKKWQQKLGYEGSDADGLPGFTSLKALGDKYKFVVIR